MSTKPQIRLHLFFARDSTKAVILRQGPSKVFRMILWDLNGDVFEDGQWLKHKVYPEVCDISPDGKHFLFFALDGKWGGEAGGSYTAISRPPYFTALALFPQGDTWGGGGHFVGSRHYFVNTDDENQIIIGQVRTLDRVYKVASSHKNTTGFARRDGSRATLPREVRKRLLEGDNWKPPLDLYDTLGGRLYRRRGQALDLIRDFTDMEFEEICAPYDTRGKTGQEPALWHPLDKEERP